MNIKKNAVLEKYEALREQAREQTNIDESRENYKSQINEYNNLIEKKNGIEMYELKNKIMNDLTDKDKELFNALFFKDDNNAFYNTIVDRAHLSSATTTPSLESVAEPVSSPVQPTESTPVSSQRIEPVPVLDQPIVSPTVPTFKYEDEVKDEDGKEYEVDEDNYESPLQDFVNMLSVEEQDELENATSEEKLKDEKVNIENYYAKMVNLVVDDDDDETYNEIINSLEKHFQEKQEIDYTSDDNDLKAALDTNDEEKLKEKLKQHLISLDPKMNLIKLRLAQITKESAQKLLEKTTGGYAKYTQFTLTRDSLHIIQNIIILNIFKFIRYTYYKKNIVNNGNESVYLLDYIMTLTICMIFYTLGFEKISMGIFIDQLLSMILYHKFNNDKVLLLPYYLPFVLS